MILSLDIKIEMTAICWNGFHKCFDINGESARIAFQASRNGTEHAACNLGLLMAVQKQNFISPSHRGKTATTVTRENNFVLYWLPHSEEFIAAAATAAAAIAAVVIVEFIYAVHFQSPESQGKPDSQNTLGHECLRV